MKEDGSNLKVWIIAFDAAGAAKGCAPAFHRPLPGTLEISAALMLLLCSVTAVWGSAMARCPTAFDGYNWVVTRFTGGTNQEASAIWKKEMEGGTVAGQYVRMPQKQWAHNT